MCPDAWVGAHAPCGRHRAGVPSHRASVRAHSGGLFSGARGSYRGDPCAPCYPLPISSRGHPRGARATPHSRCDRGWGGRDRRA